MADRYTKLFSLTKDLYIEGSPVVIAAGALLFDNKTNKVLAQLKVRNIGRKAIKAITVKITPLDTAGRPLGEPVMSQYLDLVLNRDQEFGQKLPIKLPNNATRSFSVSVAEVVFTDNEIWSCNQDDWKPLSETKPLESWLTDRELLKQYKMRYGLDCSYVPERIEDLWYCVCGAINRNDEESCHNCGKSISTLLSVDLAELTAEKNARMEKEAEAEAARLKKKAEEEAARQKREAEEKAAAEARMAENRRKAQNITIIVLAALAAIIGAVLLVTKVIIPYVNNNTNYNNALALVKDGNIIEGYESLVALNGYKDSEIRASEIRAKYLAEKLKSAEVGDYIVFGSYEQDNNIANGKEDIEWLVLAKEDNKILVISRYALDEQNYNETDEPVTWEKCFLRGWLNETFINDAFDLDEKKLIHSAIVKADKNPWYDTLPRTDTMDRVFLLSITEVEKFFKSRTERRCLGTAYYLAKHPISNSGFCFWWLRTPGADTDALGKKDGNAAYVGSEGIVWYMGYSVTSKIAVRPSLWINLEPEN